MEMGQAPTNGILSDSDECRVSDSSPVKKTLSIRFHSSPSHGIEKEKIRKIRIIRC